MKTTLTPSDINILSKTDTMGNVIELIKHDLICTDTTTIPCYKLWDDVRISRFIESILIRLPMRALYFDASYEKRWIIADGWQRLLAVRKFVIDGELTLTYLEYLDFTGKTYGELPIAYRRKIEECPVTIFLIQPGTPEPVKQSILKRINSRYSSESRKLDNLP